MNMNRILLVVGLLVAAAVAESIRETETMDPTEMFESLIESSGSLPDDEDFEEPNYYDELDSDLYDEGTDSFDEISGSGDSEEIDDLESTEDTPTTTMGNKIPENDLIDPKFTIDDNVFHLDNDIILKKKILEVDPSNEISMASTAHNFFNRTEVVVAVVAGALVGLLFAVFIIVFLLKRKNKDVAYDTVKKPIYKKAPTIEV